jgi:hypothetical protein
LILRRLLFGLLAGALALAEANGMDQARQIFDAIDALVNARTESFEQLAALTRVTLHEAPGNTFTLIRTGAFAPGSVFETIEIRKPRNAQSPGGLINLTLRADGCVPPASLTARYGEINELAPPLAGGPPDRPVYWVYHRPWGDLSFAVVEKDGTQCLSGAVIDWY